MLKCKGQSTLEYALIIAVVIAGLLLMQHYVRRGFAGRLKEASDDMGEQYDPTTYSGDFTVSQSSKVTQTTKDRETETLHIADQVSTRTGTETVGAWQADEDLFSK